MLKKTTMFLFFLWNAAVCAGVDFIVFSYDRPMQLFALLESTEKYITGIDSVSVIYRTSSEQFDVGYEKCFSYFQDRLPLFLLKQGSKPLADFKPLLLKAILEIESEYVMFGVDDDIVKDKIDISECVDLLERTGAHGFHLKLGMNTIFSYGYNSKMPFPFFDKVAPNVYTWKTLSAKNDWGYPNTVDMTIYRKSDIVKDLVSMSYTNPNTFESRWDGRADRTKCDLCFEKSKIVNIPLNRVQNVCNNRSMNFFSVEALLEKFLSGLKINIELYHNIDNKSPHWPYFPENVFTASN